MREDLLRQITSKLRTDYKFEQKGKFLRKGRCPKEEGGCGERELYTPADRPWILRCGRQNNCGWEGRIKDLYPDLFENWSERFKATEQDPNAAADAYLLHERGFDLLGLRGAYTQERYHDNKLNIGTATVRFPMPCGGYWERLIDQAHRFGGQKARFSYGIDYAGTVWMYPGVTMKDLARASEIWLDEGIFDTIDLVQKGRLQAVSLMTCNNYPAKFLAELRKVCGEENLPTPKLVFALDPGAAGTRYIRQFVKQARAEGWTAGAAQSSPDGEGEKHDWNDLGLRGELKPEDLDRYRWNGEVTIAESASAKAMLFYTKDRRASFPLIFGGRQLWANFSLERIQGVVQQMMESAAAEGGDKAFLALSFDEQWMKAAEEAVEIDELANCTFRTLYYQRDPYIEEGAYFLRIDFPTTKAPLKATFSGASLSGSGDFKKRLASIAAGAQWTGNQYQLDKLMQRQWTAIRTVEALQFTGYSKDHEAYLFGDFAVHKGRVHKPNEDDYFVLGKRSVKLRTTDRMLRISYDAEALDLGWVKPLTTAYGPKGLVVLAFWVLALFAEQIRAEQESLAFLEMTGEPGSGKTTLLSFMWKLVGRAPYEGFDPTKGTIAGIARTLGQVGNLPVVLIEGDRTQETTHARRFEWDELKTAYNGRPVRTRAIANGGMETFEPPFRGALVIAQNDTVQGSPAVTERLMGIHFDKGRFSPEGKAAGDALKIWDMTKISGFPVHIARREAEILAKYRERYAVYEPAMRNHPGCGNYRFAHNHAQLAAMLDAMCLVVKNIPAQDLAAAHQLILHMLVDRHRVTETDHPHVVQFWERFDHFNAVDLGHAHNTDSPIDHYRKNDLHAINLVQFEMRCASHGLRMPCSMQELKRALKTSKARAFVEVKPVNSITGKTVSCWLFRNPNHTTAKGA